jgi:hypothetical protein
VGVVTAHFTGGIGAKAVGSDVFGGKRYVFFWAAIAGYFALSSVPVPNNRRQLLAGLFFLSSATAALSNFAFMLGEKFYFLFLLFPPEWAIAQAASEYQLGGFTRIGGLAPASLAMISFLLVRYGIKGTLSLRSPWRLALLLFAMTAGLFSGFRGTLALMLMLFAIQFFLEGLHKTKFLGVVVVACVLIGATVLPIADRLPLPVQRCLTMLPLDLDATAIDAARGSTDWRLEMWRSVIPDIPKYFWLGKGFAIDPKDLYFAQQNISLRVIAPYEAALVAGDYHSGPLTLMLPFGIWGVLGFIWFCVASLKVLWRNYKYGDEEIHNLNTYLLTIFIARLAYFILIFGAFYMDLAIFTGIIGLSVSLNRGVASPKTAPEPVAAEPEEEPVRALTWQPAFSRRLQQT